jgi:F0F1-type ATP synthase assembly protein I
MNVAVYGGLAATIPLLLAVAFFRKLARVEATLKTTQQAAEPLKVTAANAHLAAAKAGPMTVRMHTEGI